MNNSIRPSDDEYFPLKKFAKLINMSLESVYNARSRGEDMPPTYKVGRCVLMRKSEFDAWILQRRKLTAEAQLISEHPAPIPTVQPRPWERTTSPALSQT